MGRSGVCVGVGGGGGGVGGDYSVIRVALNLVLNILRKVSSRTGHG